MISITERIFKTAKEKKVKKSKMAREIGVSREMMYKMTDQNIKYATIKKMAVVLNVTVAYLTNNDNNEAHLAAGKTRRASTKKKTALKKAK